ncbi:hypothetical protein [uncultured Roseibium sp.]|uniref:hypothetical protein n=1 Tax=uncultured Roseibium sp. TaxID=1936171 RepID=UPI003216DF89
MRAALSAAVLYCFGVSQAPAQDAVEAEIEALRAAAHKMAVAFASDAVEPVGKVSLDLMFVFQELTALQKNAALVGEVCTPPDADITLRTLSEPDCLAALMSMERQVWRLAAELAADAHLIASKRLADTLPLPPIPEADWTEAREAEVAEWWARAAPTALEAVSRVGREWIKQRGDEEEIADRALRRLARALRQIEQEPAVAQLRNAVNSAPEFASLAAPLRLIVDPDQALEDRAEAAVRFAAAYAGLQADALKQVFSAPIDANTCPETLPKELRDARWYREELCTAAFDRLKAVSDALDEPRGAASGAYAALEAEIEARAAEVDAFTAALTEAFDERILTIRLLVAKAEALPRAGGNCTDVARAMDEPEEAITGPLSEGRLRRAAERLAGVMTACAEQSLTDQLTLMCRRTQSVLAGPIERFDTRIRAVPSALPSPFDNDLQAPWEALVSAAGRDGLAGICEGTVSLDPATLKRKAEALEDPAAAALERLQRAAVQSLQDKALASLEGVLDRVKVPVDVTADVETGLTALCDMVAPLSPVPEGSVRRAVSQAVLNDLGLVDNGAPVAEVALMCTELRKGTGVWTGAAFSDAFNAVLQDSLEETQAAAVVARLDEAMDRLQQSGDRLAQRAATAAVILEGSAVLDRVVSMQADSGCGPEAETDESPALNTGLDMGLLSKKVERRLGVEDGRWTIHLGAELNLAVCGLRSNDPKALHQVVSVVEASTQFSEAFDVDTATDPVAVADQLRAAMRRAVEEAEITVDEALLNAQLRRIAAAAGLDLDALARLRLGPLSGSGFDKQYGLLLRVALPEPVNQSFCLSVPTDPARVSPDCPSFEDAESVVAAMAEAIARQAFDALAATVGAELQRFLADSKGLAAIEDLLQDTAEITVVRAPSRTSGEILSWVRLTVPESAIADLTTIHGLAPLTGAFVLQTTLDGDRLDQMIVERPTVNGVALVRRALSLLPSDSDLLVLKEIGAPDPLKRDDLPQALQDVASARDRTQCAGAYVVSVAFGRQAPVQGPLGFVCVQPSGDDPWLVLGPDVELKSPDGDWRIRVRAVESDASDDGGIYDLNARVSSRTPLFAEVDNDRALLRIDLPRGVVSLPSDVDENAKLYLDIENALSAQLPRGVRVHGLQFASEGLDISIDPSGAIDEAWRSLSDMLSEEAAVWQAWAEDVGETLQEASEAYCEHVVPLQRLGQTLADGVLAPVPEVCTVREPDEGRIHLRDQQLTWSCSGNSIAPGREVDYCDLELPDDIGLCGDSVDIRFDWRGTERPDKPEVRSADLDECIEDTIDNLLPRDQLGYDRIEVSLGFDGACSDLNRLSDCAITGAFTLDLSDLADQLTEMGSDTLGRIYEAEACGLDAPQLDVTAMVSLDGTLRFGAGASGLDALETRFQRCADALAAGAAEAALSEVMNEVDLSDLYQGIADAGSSVLVGATNTLGATLDGEASCTLKSTEKDTQKCDAYSGEDVQTGRVTGAIVTAPYEILGEDLKITADLSWSTTALSVRTLDPGALEEWTESQAKGLFNPTDARLSLTCPQTQEGDCLNELARHLGDSISGKYLQSKDGATLIQTDKRFELTLPYDLVIDELGLRSSVDLRCIIDLDDFPNVAAPDCGAQGLSPEALVMDAVARILAEGPLEVGQTLDFGLIAFEIKQAPDYKPSLGRIEMTAEASFTGLGIDETVDAKITLDRNLTPDIDADYNTLTSNITEQLTSGINDLLGDFGVKITNLTLDPLDGSMPEALLIDSEANIAGLFSITAPQVRLSEAGLEIQGPNRFGISFGEGITIPVPPLAICPNGGAIEDTELTIKAAVTVAECSASYLLNYRGSMTMDIERPLKVTTKGALTLLSIIPLGSNEGVIDLGKPFIQHEAEIGGAVSDILSMRGQFTIDGPQKIVTADSSVKVFTVPVGDGRFLLDLDQGILDTATEFNIAAFLRGNGAVRTGKGFSRPEAAAGTRMSIAGFDAFSADLKARANLARARLSVLGLRLTVAFPGLQALDPSRIADMLKNLLTPNFEDLDKALEALFSGNVTINPFAGFGSGGDGMGDDGDGDAGDSTSDGKAQDPGDGLGDGTDPPLADAGAPEAIPPGGTPGLLGDKVAALWFEPLGGDPARVQIGKGTKGTPEYEKLTVARIAPGHFNAEGQPMGKTLSTLTGGYSQMQTGTVEALDGYGGCTTGPGNLVYLYTGETVDRRGYYELCRVSIGADNRPVTDLTILSKDERSLLVAFHTALIGEMATRPEVPDGDYDRLLLRGRIVQNVQGTLSGTIGFQRVGELLVVMRGAFEDNTACGEPPAPSGEEAKTKSFWLTGMRQGDLDDPQVVFEAVQALWNCEDGTLGRIDPTNETLATTESLSKKAADGYQIVSPMEPPKDPEPEPRPTPPWPQPEPGPQPEPQPEPEPVPGPEPCSSDCGSIPVRIGELDDGCGIWLFDQLSGRYPRGGLGGDICEPAAETRIVGSSLGQYTHFYVPVDETRAHLLLSLTNGYHQTDTPLSFVGGAAATPARAKQVSDFLDVYARSSAPGGFKAVRVLSDLPSREALEAPLPDVGGRLWVVRQDDRVWSVKQTGEALPEDKALALLTVLTEDVLAAEVTTPDRLILVRPEALWVYRWADGAWEGIAQIADDPRREQVPSARAVAKELYDVIGPVPDAPHRVQIVPYESRIEAWAYAIEDGNDEPGRLMVRRAVFPRNEIVEQRAGALTETRTSIDLPSNGALTRWLDVTILAGTEQFTIDLEPLDEGDKDPYLCLYSMDGTGLAGDDDDGPDLYSRMTWRPKRGETRYVLQVTEYGNGAVPPVRAVLSLNTAYEASGRPTRCESPDVAERIDYFGPSYQEVQINGLSLILQDRRRLLAVAKEALEAPSTGTLVAFAADNDTNQRLTARAPVYLAQPDGADLLFRRFVPQAGDVDAIAPFARITNAMPPSHAWSALAQELDRDTADITQIAGRSVALIELSAGGAAVSEAWQTSLPRHAGTGHRVFLKLGDTPRWIDLSGDFASDELVEAALRYMLGSDISSLTLLQASPPLARAESGYCGEGSTSCEESLVLLPSSDTAEAVVLPLPTKAAPPGALETVKNLFVQVATQSPEQLPDVAARVDPWRLQDKRLLQFTKDGPLHVVADDGRWACLRTDHAGAASPRAQAALAYWPDVDLAPSASPQLCNAPGVVVWQYAPAPRESAVGMLYRTGDETPLDLVALNTAAPRVATGQTVPDALKTLLVGRLQGSLRPEDDLRALPDTALPAVLSEKAVILEVIRPDNRLVWLAGLQLPRSDKPPLVCVLGNIEASLPSNLPEEIKKQVLNLTLAAVTRTVEAFDEDNDTLCPRIQQLRINVVEADGAWDIWEELSEAAIVPQDTGPGVRRVRLAQAEPGAWPTLARSTPALTKAHRLHGTDLTLRFDRRLTERLDDAAAREARAPIKSAVAGLFRAADLTHGSRTLSLTCATDCTRLEGKTSAGEWIAVVIDPAGGRASAIGFTDVASAQYATMHNFALGLAADRLAACSSRCFAWFDLGVAGEAVMAAERPYGTVLGRKDPVDLIRPYGDLPEEFARPFNERTPDEIRIALRDAVLQRAAERMVPFTVQRLTNGWTGPDAPALMSFPEPGAPLIGHRVVFPSGAEGPLYWSSRAVIDTDSATRIVTHLSLRLGASRLLEEAIWIPGPPSDAPLFRLETAPSATGLTLAERLDANARPDVFFDPACTVALEQRDTFIQGLAALAPEAAVTCIPDATDRLAMLQSGVPSALAVTPDAFAVLDIDTDFSELGAGFDAQAEAVLRLATPALDQAFESVQLWTADIPGIVLATADTGFETAVWRDSPGTAPDLVGGFQGYRVARPEQHRLLAQMTPVASLATRGRFLDIEGWDALLYDETRLNVLQGDRIRVTRFLNHGDARPETLAAEIAAYLTASDPAANMIAEAILVPAGDAFLVMETASRKIAGAWVKPAMGAPVGLTAPSTWPQDLAAGLAADLAVFLRPNLSAGHSLAGLFAEGNTLVACGRATAVSPGVDEGLILKTADSGENRVRAAHTDLAMRFHAPSCGIVRRHLAFVVSTPEQITDVAQMDLLPRTNSQHPDVVIATPIPPETVAQLWVGQGTLDKRCLGTFASEARELLRLLAKRLWEAGASCDWYKAPAEGTVALLAINGQVTVLDSRNGIIRDIGLETTSAADHDMLLTWFLSVDVTACSNQPLVHTVLSDGAQFLDDPCGVIATAPVGATAFAALMKRLSRAEATPLSRTDFDLLNGRLMPKGADAPFRFDVLAQDDSRLLAVTGAGSGMEQDWIILSDRGCLLVSLETLGRAKLDDLSGRLLPDGSPRHLLLRAVNLKEQTPIWLLAQTDDRACEATGRTNLDDVPPVTQLAGAWTFEVRAMPGTPWYPLQLQDDPDAVLARAPEDAVISEYIAAQLRADVTVTHLWLRPEGQDALFVVGWDAAANPTLCVHLLNAQRGGYVTTKATIDMRLAGAHREGLGLKALIDRLEAQASDTDFAPRWYEPFVADPRALALRDHTPGAACVPESS